MGVIPTKVADTTLSATAAFLGQRYGGGFGEASMLLANLCYLLQVPKRVTSFTQFKLQPGRDRRGLRSLSSEKRMRADNSPSSTMAFGELHKLTSNRRGIELCSAPAQNNLVVPPTAAARDASVEPLLGLGRGPASPKTAVFHLLNQLFEGE